MLAKLTTNQISGCLFKTTITSQKTNYENQFKINQILKDEIEKKKPKRIQRNKN